MKTIYYRQIRQNLIKYIDLTPFFREIQKPKRNYNKLFCDLQIAYIKEYNPISNFDFCMYKRKENQVCSLFDICN